ncbi:MAG: hypothetical protein AB7I50_15070 [Vicinamibacterales bacterium]
MRHRHALRWALLIWIGLAVVVWNGFFDLLVSRGEKQYFLERARFELGLDPEPSLHEIMRATRHDAARSASIWALLVVVAGAGTAVLLTRR